MIKNNSIRTNIVKLIEVRNDLINNSDNSKSAFNQNFGKTVSSFILENKFKLLEQSFKERTRPSYAYLYEYIKEESSLLRRFSVEEEIKDHFQLSEAEESINTKNLQRFTKKKNESLGKYLSLFLLETKNEIKTTLYGSPSDYEFVIEIDGWGYFWAKRTTVILSVGIDNLIPHTDKTERYLKLRRKLDEKK